MSLLLMGSGSGSPCGDHVLSPLIRQHRQHLEGIGHHLPRTWGLPVAAAQRLRCRGQPNKPLSGGKRSAIPARDTSKRCVPKGGENGPRVGWGIWGHGAQPLHLPVGAMEINICAWVLRGARLVHHGCYGD